MAKTSRRNLFRVAAAGGAAAGLGLILKPETTAPVMAQGQSEDHNHRPISGPLSQVTVSFGQWRTDPPLDRISNAPPPPTANQHLMTPNEATVQAGGAITFLIAGLHQIAIYDHGTRPTDIRTNLVVPMAGPPGLPLINDPNKRIYRGPDPSLLPQDRIEAVTIAKPGTYLVICNFLFHFQDNMFGYIRVLP